MNPLTLSEPPVWLVSYVSQHWIGNRLTAVVLKNFVSCTEGTTALDGGGSAGRLLFDGESILADLRPPDVGQGTASEAGRSLASEYLGGEVR